MGLLPHLEIVALQEVFVSLDVDWMALRGGLPARVRSDLPQMRTPGGQILSDLHDLNDLAAKASAEPLVDLLQSALALSKPRMESSVIETVLARVKELVAARGRPDAELERAEVDPLPLPPPPPSDFVGRAPELRALDALWAAEAPGIAPRGIITGVGGVGKTALALTFADRARARFPGGVLWGALGTRREEGDRGAASTPASVLRSVLIRWEAELGRSVGADRPTDALLGSVRQLLVRRTASVGRCLLVLDNVDAAETLAPLAEGFLRCPMLVTSRAPGQLLLAGWQQVDLGGLDPESAKELLSVENGAPPVDPSSMMRVAEYVQFHPFALRLLSRALRSSPGVDLEEELRELQARPQERRSALGFIDQPESLRACFGFSMAALAPSSRPLLLSLASHSPMGAPIDAIDHVSGICDLRRTRTELGTLRDAGLVEHFDGDRYGVHRLLRDYLRSVHAVDGLGRLSWRTWELASLPWFLMRCGGWGRRTSAGLACYDFRQEHWFHRFALAHHNEPATLRREWDSIALGAYQRRDRAAAEAASMRLSALAAFLEGADLRGIAVHRLRLDGARLDGATLEDADLSGGPLRYLPAPQRILRGVGRSAAWGFGWVMAGACVAFLFWWTLAGADRGGVRSFVGTSLLALVPVVVSVPVGELLARVLVSGGRWFDTRSWRTRLLAERAVVAMCCGLTGALLLPVCVVTFGNFGPMTTGEVAMLAVAPSVPAALYGASAPMCAFVAGALQRRGIGGLMCRAAASGALFALWTLVILALAILMTVFISDQGALESATLAFWPTLSLALLAAPIYGAARRPEATVELASQQASYLRRASMKGANLRRAKLRWARMAGADLSAAVLEGADLEHASLSAARLVGANLAGAILAGADLSRADLEGADLTRCDLTRCDLTGANLRGARLVDPKKAGAIVTDTTLLADQDSS